MSFFRAVKSFHKGAFFRVSCIALLSFSVMSCDLAANYTKTDRAANMDFQDFRDGMAERLPEVEESKSAKSSAAIPDLQPYISTNTQTVKAMPLVSVSVNQTVPIRDVLYELAQQAEYDLELDPNIRGSVIFTARNKPFDLVIERIANIAGLRYKFEDGFLRVEVDSPYNKTYKIDYLSFIRTSNGGVTTSVSVVSGEGADTGSTFNSSMDSVSDFWGELETNLEQIVTGTSTGALRTSRDPRITAVAQNPEVAAVAPTQGEDGQPQVQPPEAVLRVESLPVEGDDASSSSSSSDSDDGGASFTINKQAGLINIFATEKAHKEAEAYLKLLKRSISSQVLVEAKVFEVSLTDEFITGIDWQALDGEGVGGFISDVGRSGLGLVSEPNARVGAENLFFAPGGDVASLSNFALGWVGNDFQALLRAISGFGTVRALASPRLTVLNNQSAVLNVATNRVFFELDVDRETDDDTGDVTVEIDTDIKSIPEGVLINVQPSIDLDNRTISLSVRPTVTRIVGEVLDPSVQFVAGDLGIQSEIPEVNVQEIDTVVKVKSGQPIVMGGLLQDRIVDTQEAVPVLGEVPLVGSLFKRQNDSVGKTELVIFLKATLIETPDQTIHNTDRDLYRAFSGDRRPFKL